MREEKDRYDRVSRRSSTGVRKETPERERRERIRMFDDTDDFYRNDDRPDGDRRDRERNNGAERREESRFDDRYEDRRRGESERRSDGERRDERYDGRSDNAYRENTRHQEERHGDGERREAPQNDRKQPPRKQAGGNRKKGRTGGDTERFVHQIVPYVMFWVALFAAVSFVLRDLVHLDAATGVFGNWFADFLCGLLGPAAYLLPLFLVVISLRWKKFVREGILAGKLLLASSFLVLLSGIIHVFMEDQLNRGFLDAGGIQLYTNGVTRSGGGFFGGFAGEWLGYILRLPGTILLGIPLLIVIGIYLVGLTPGDLWQRISIKFKQAADRRRERERTLYDGKEDRRLRVNGKANNKQKELPVSPKEGKANTAERTHYAFREEEDEPMPRPAPRTSKTEEKKRPAPKAFEPIDIVDIPDDEPEIDEPREDARKILEHAGHTDDSDRKLNEILREMSTTRTADSGAVAKTPVAEEKPLQGSYYAPFALPVRPEPKHDRPDPTTGHIVITPHEGEHAPAAEQGEDHPLRGTTTVGPLGSSGGYTAPARHNEESLGNTRPASQAPARSSVSDTVSAGEAPRNTAPAPQAFELPRREPVTSTYGQPAAPAPSQPVTPAYTVNTAPATPVREGPAPDTGLGGTGMTFAHEEAETPAAEKERPRTEEGISVERERLTVSPLGSATRAPREVERPVSVEDHTSFSFDDEPEEESTPIRREPARGMRTSFSLPGEETEPAASSAV
ncbi:MAG: hypothetical protein IJX39_05815, partial [Clostridia bacterium]|nr:hypothetical protein [Clostridia bacterium]